MVVIHQNVLNHTFCFLNISRCTSHCYLILLWTLCGLWGGFGDLHLTLYNSLNLNMTAPPL